MKVIIAGGRKFDNYKLLVSKCDKALSVVPHVEIVSGGAIGADNLGQIYAIEKGYDIKVFPADWLKYGKRAGPIRNEEMAKYADALIAFWDGKSKGTKHMIDLAKSNNIRVFIVNY